MLKERTGEVEALPQLETAKIKALENYLTKLLP